MAGKSEGSGVNVVGLVYLLCIFAALFVPAILARFASPPGPPDSESDEGWGNGPRKPPPPPPPPRGGIPLPDADPASVRLRDHARLSARGLGGERRFSREPHRRPVRTSRRTRAAAGPSRHRR
jgi:hypothetical protein